MTSRTRLSHGEISHSPRTPRACLLRTETANCFNHPYSDKIHPRSQCTSSDRSTLRRSTIFIKLGLPPSRSISCRICFSRLSRTSSVYSKDFVRSLRYDIVCIFSVGVAGRFCKTSRSNFGSAKARKRGKGEEVSLRICRLDMSA